MSSETFLTQEQEKRVVDAIARAELQTSGEVRVHLEQYCKKEPLERAARIFYELGMGQTQLQNGVLIYIATKDQKAAVYAGKGIHKQVPDNFWGDVLQIILTHFRKGEFDTGIVKAIEQVAKQLKEIFPYQAGDKNELPDDISYNDNKDT